MTKEQEKAIKNLKEFAYTIHGTLSIGEAKTILNLIENLKKENADLQKSVKQIYDDYQDIGKMAFDYSDKIEEQDKIIDKLKKHNDELLRKLKNRVKQVKKLEKYSTYKSEFSRLNKKIVEQDKIIDLMLEDLKKQYCHYEPCYLDNEVKCKEHKNCKACIKQYFENKAKEVK